MGIQKEVKKDNGIILNYHRIVSVNSVTNVSTDIIVASYINQEKRLEEKEYQKLQEKENRTQEEDVKLLNIINNVIETDYIQIPYDKNMNVDSAYEYLVTLDKYKNAKNV